MQLLAYRSHHNYNNNNNNDNDTVDASSPFPVSASGWPNDLASGHMFPPSSRASASGSVNNWNHNNLGGQKATNKTQLTVCRPAILAWLTLPCGYLAFFNDRKWLAFRESKRSLSTPRQPPTGKGPKWPTSREWLRLMRATFWDLAYK